MKKLWVNAVPYNKDVAIAALESGADAVVLPELELLLPRMERLHGW